MNDLSQILEASMLLCFGVAWPLCNLRLLRTRQVQGKGLPFTIVILTGYVCGALSKVVDTSTSAALAPVFWLYLLNIGSVGLNVVLQWRFRCAAGPQSTATAT